ncbi:MAG: hypothetical protein F6K40_12470 [Okeania sp. SIO3I5]|uniref:hypothetical protein n=1 Tax=Okeania sp. SIO3I5 TaxID=2607805 RepID=UPI0013B96D34|nr:hypothetical protein [Okeania sp. SIO3I5]NEQ37044.1 hypothetical protein [Okeania sp. SIO3I5]
MMTDDCNLRVATGVSSQMIENSREVIPLLDDSNSHLLKILTAKIGNFSIDDDREEALETGDNIIVASFSGAIPGVKDSYTKEEVSNCDVDFTRFIFEEAA